MEVAKAEAFVLVADELHFGRAASRLHVTQSALSRIIRQLESELGVVLFTRTTREVALTPEGAALYEPARELVMQSQRIVDLARRVHLGEAGRVRLGFAGASVGPLIATLARQLRAERPGISLELHSSEFSFDALEKLVDGSLDLALGRWDFLPAQVGSTVIARERLLVALPEGHRLAGADALGPEELADESWLVLPGRSSATLPNRLNLLGVAGRFVPRVLQIAPDSSTLLLLISVGAGIGLTFSGVQEHIRSEGVVFRPLRAFPDTVEVALAWRRTDTDPAAAAVRDIAERTLAASLS